jgi:anti-sigma factor RsiW
MIRCQDILREISEYLDAEVTPEMRSEIERHAKACKHCKVLISTTRMTLTLVSNSKFLELPKGVSERLLERLKRHST